LELLKKLQDEERRADNEVEVEEDQIEIVDDEAFDAMGVDFEIAEVKIEDVSPVVTQQSTTISATIAIGSPNYKLPGETEAEMLRRNRKLMEDKMKAKLNNRKIGKEDQHQEEVASAPAPVKISVVKEEIKIQVETNKSENSEIPAGDIAKIKTQTENKSSDAAGSTRSRGKKKHHRRKKGHHHKKRGTKRPSSTTPIKSSGGGSSMGKKYWEKQVEEKEKKRKRIGRTKKAAKNSA